MTFEELQNKHNQEWETYFADHKAALERMLITKSLSVAIGEDQASKKEEALQAFESWRAYWGVNGTLVKSIKERQQKEREEFFAREENLKQLKNAKALLKEKGQGEREL